MVCLRSCGAGVAVLLLAGLATQASGQGTAGAAGPRTGNSVVEGVVAVVGDTPILRSELDDRFQVLSPQFEIQPGDTARANQLRREILDNLVSEQLLLQEADAQGLKADQEQIDAAVSSAVDGDRGRLGPDGFAAQLTKEGITEADLRARYAAEARKEMLRRQLLQREIVAKVVVTDAQVEQQFRENKDKIGKRPRALRVLDLFVRTMPDSLIESTYRKRADEVRTEIDGGLAFEEAAKRYSDDEKSRDQGGLLGRFGPGDLGDRTFEKAAFSGAVGSVVGPLRTNLGFHLIQILDRDPQGAWVQIRHILIAVPTSRSDENRTRQRIESVRADIVSGKLDYGDAVRRYSDDVASREAGGDVGWLPIDNFLGETKGAVDSLRVGEVSRVAAVEGGFHLFKLVGEQAETDYTLDEIRDELRGMVENQERQKRLDAYLQELRKKIYVEIHPL
jgi:peptidyl-prolyl cis-trans isomerase SurA